MWSSGITVATQFHVCYYSLNMIIYKPHLWCHQQHFWLIRNIFLPIRSVVAGDVIYECCKRALLIKASSHNFRQNNTKWNSIIDCINASTDRTNKVYMLLCTFCRWLKNHAPVEKSRRIKVRTRDFWSRLAINDLDVLDSGYYQCIVSNSVASVNTTGVLRVRLFWLFACAYINRIYCKKRKKQSILCVFLFISLMNTHPVLVSFIIIDNSITNTMANGSRVVVVVPLPETARDTAVCLVIWTSLWINQRLL
jgi:hypothetical protein